MVGSLGLLYRIDGKFDVHGPLNLPATVGAGEFLRRLGPDRVAIIVKPNQLRGGPRRIPGLQSSSFHDRRATRNRYAKSLVQFAIIDIQAKARGCGEEIGAIAR